ncbi:Reverse transcriptase (RNA-dependent DNA polymerase) [Popillia japonica]|uniref:Reverse transcriptase (RNA-dependent DNA polymerase) n=1 Tax=Popillia japonica TaxID=7064 RepID=A0AAW1M3B5_POPJA
MNGGKYFCTLDIQNAYLHMKVDDATAVMQAISTHKGVYKVNRLMFGVKVAPSAWQRFMDQILQDLDGVVCFFDDMAIQGKTPGELLSSTTWLYKGKPQANYFRGHRIDGKGLHTLPERVRAIMESPKPRNVSQLRTFLGLLPMGKPKARKWVFGTVVAKTGHLHYDILIDGSIHRRHVDQLLPYPGVHLHYDILIDGSIHRRHVDQLLPYPGVLPLERHHIPNSSTSPSTEDDDSKIGESAATSSQEHLEGVKPDITNKESVTDCNGTFRIPGIRTS